MQQKSITTLESFVEASNIDGQLIRAVVKQFGGWQSFKESASDVCRGGIDGGFHGFIYTADTEPFAKRNKRSIQALAESQAKDFGIEITRMIQGFGCFRGSDVTSSEIGRALYAGENQPDGHNVLNALAWYAGDEVCRSYCDLTGEND